MEHRLAAVLAADMVGYSRLMEADERGTLARLRTHRIELIDPAIAKNQGRIIKTTGTDAGRVPASPTPCRGRNPERMRRHPMWRTNDAWTSASVSTSATSSSKTAYIR
jgi:class 3 adenylate cyclase